MLDDFCGFSNWHKMVQFGGWLPWKCHSAPLNSTIGDDLLRLQLEALPAAFAFKEDFEKFDANLRASRADDVEKWEAMVLAWEEDRVGNPSPFLLPTPSEFPCTFRCDLYG